MKFEITEEQKETLTNCVLIHSAANLTLNEALKHHQETMIENQRVSEALWQEFEQEFELDMSLDWQFMLLNGTPYIVSQKRQPDETGNK